MTWFTASVLVAIKPHGYTSGPVQVYENMYLVEAPTSSEALAKARKLGVEEAAIIDDGLTIDEEPAFREFVGVRKLINVSNPTPLRQDEDRPTDGTELTYSLYEVEDVQALQELASGNPLRLVYVE